MSKISNLIFKNAKHIITSKYGKRNIIKTSAGTTSSFHKGTDYGTYGKKISQYAIEDGTIYSCGTDTDGAKFVTVLYPRIKKRFLHWHLDTISVKKGQKVKKYTKLGTTGMTGKATGIHLHLGIIDTSNNTYIDPEVYAKQYTEPSTKTTTTATFKKGDKIILNGFLYIDSMGTKKGVKKTNYKGTITIVNSKGTKPYHIDSLGWVSSNDIKKQTSVITKIVNATSGLNMRSKIGTTSSIIVTIPYNSKVTVLTTEAGTKNGYVWSKIKYNNKIGYVASKYLK